MRRSTNHLTLRLLGVALLSLTALACSVTPASAAREYECQITAKLIPSATECYGAGNRVPGGSFIDVWGATVVPGDDVWLLDPGKHAVDRFSASGKLIRATEGENSYWRSMAYSSAVNQLYIGDSLGGAFWSLDPNANHINEYVGAYTTGSFVYVAADNSGGPDDGSLYLSASDGTPEHQKIYKMDSVGNPVNFSAAGDPGKPYIQADTLTGTPTEPFSFDTEGGRLAVDGGGHIVVSDDIRKVIDVFNSSGVFVREITGTPGGPFGSVRGVGVDPTTEDILVVDPIKKTVEEFDPSGTYVGTVSGVETPTGSFSYNMRDVAINSTGRLYVSDAANNVVDIFGPNLALPKIAYSAPSGIGTGFLTLHGSADPNGGGPIIDCHFEYGKTASYGQSVPCQDSGGATVGTPANPITSPAEVNADVPDVEPNAVYYYRLVLGNAGGTRKGLNQTLHPPSINAVLSANLTETEADLRAKVNPGGLDTVYRFEYGPTTEYGNSVPIPDGDLGAGTADVGAEAHITVQIGVEYHFRIVAENALSADISEDQTFSYYPPVCPNSHVRQETSAGYLPDCRAYELVSPSNANGTIFFGAGPNSAYAENPPRLSYVGSLGIPSDAGDPINAVGDLYVASRTDSGWVSKYIGLPSNQAAAMGGPPVPGYIAQLCCQDRFQNGVLTNPSMSKFVNWNDGNGFMVGCTSGCFTDTNTNAIPENAPYVWNANGTLIDRWPTNLSSVPGADAIHKAKSNVDLSAMYSRRGFAGAVAASRDLSHFVFSSRETAFAPNGLTKAPGSAYDNDIATRTVSLISKTPDGDDIQQEPNWGDTSRTCMNDGDGGFEFGPPRDCEYIRFPGQTMNAGVDVGSVSTDGSHILMSTSNRSRCYWHQNEECPPDFAIPVHLYMRVNDAVTYDVSEGHLVAYVGMTPDASRIFFTSTEPLTADDHDASRDLFMWQEGVPLTRISVGAEGDAGNTDNCLATWVDDQKCGVLSASTVESQHSADGLETNLESTMTLGSGWTDKFIAAASGDIYFYSPERLAGELEGVDGQRNLYVFRNGHVQYVTTLEPKNPVFRIQVNPDDSRMAFVTESRIGGPGSYDNHGFREMYTYNTTTRKLRCVSCIPDGSPPTSDVRASSDGLFMSNDGRAFFSTRDGLVRTDTNKIRDVYEYVGGRAQLITSGTGSVDLEGRNTSNLNQINGISLLGVNASGDDIYFTSFESLVPQDHNGSQLKVYDARTNGGFPAPPVPAPCPAADECHGPDSSAPADPRIGTSGDLGAGGNAPPKPHRGNRRKRPDRKKRHRSREKREQSHGHDANRGQR